MKYLKLIVVLLLGTTIFLSCKKKYTIDSVNTKVSKLNSFELIDQSKFNDLVIITITNKIDTLYVARTCRSISVVKK